MFREHIENLQWKWCANSAEQYKTKVKGFIHDTFVEYLADLQIFAVLTNAVLSPVQTKHDNYKDKVLKKIVLNIKE